MYLKIIIPGIGEGNVDISNITFLLKICSHILWHLSFTQSKYIQIVCTLYSQVLYSHKSVYEALLYANCAAETPYNTTRQTPPTSATHSLCPSPQVQPAQYLKGEENITWQCYLVAIKFNFDCNIQECILLFSLISVMGHGYLMLCKVSLIY